MSITHLLLIADQLISISNVSEALAMTREELQQEVIELARKLRAEADRLDFEMDREYVKSLETA